MHPYSLSGTAGPTKAGVQDKLKPGRSQGTSVLDKPCAGKERAHSPQDMLNAQVARKHLGARQGSPEGKQSWQGGACWCSMHAAVPVHLNAYGYCSRPGKHGSDVEASEGF